MSNKSYFFLIVFLFFSQSGFANTKCLKYGVIPYSNIIDIKNSYVEWQKYLSSKIDRCIKISFESSYSNLISKFVDNQLDMAFVGPFSYVLIKKSLDVEPIVTAITSDGSATYKSYMVVTKEVSDKLNIQKRLQGATGMELLKKRFDKYKQKWMISFTDESSTSGYAIPNYYMKKINMEPIEYFKKVTFVGTHDAAQLVVHNNIIPIAFSAQMHYEKLLKKQKINKDTNRVIWESDEIPKSPIIIRKDISPELKKKIQDALINIPKEKFPTISKEIGYIKTDEKSYKIIESIHEYLKNR